MAAYRLARICVRASRPFTRYKLTWPVAYWLWRTAARWYEWASGQDFYVAMQLYQQIGEAAFAEWLKHNDQFQTDRAKEIA